MNLVPRLLATSAFVALSPLVGASSEEWIPLNETDLEISAGTVLDRSDTVEGGDAGRFGRLQIGPSGETFEFPAQPGIEQRFLCATIAYSPPTGGFPTRDETDRLAVLLRRAGYNAARIHFADAMLMSGRYEDFDYDPVQLDRFYYMLHALKREGVYWFLDAMSSWNGAYGAVSPHRWVKAGYDTKFGIYFREADRQHWVRMIQTLLARDNPYTKQSILSDPALAGLILVNEGGLNFLFRDGPRSEAEPYFRKWLLKRYSSTENLRAVWEGELAPAENIEAGPILLPSRGSGTRRAAEFQEFIAHTETEAVKWMREQLHAQGYHGLYTSLNNWTGLNAAVARRSLSFVDMHYYVDLPTGGIVDPGTKLKMQRLLDSRSVYLAELSWARQAGKPFSVTEFGQPFWNPWRYEVAPMTAAYGRLQKWSLVCHYGTTIDLSRPARGPWRALLTPFNVGQDPTLRAGEVIAALLFKRGDVSPSDAAFTVAVDKEVAARAAPLAAVPRSLNTLPYVVRTRMALTGDAGTSNVSADLLIGEDGRTTDKLNEYVRADPRQTLLNDARLGFNLLRQKQHLAETNLSDPTSERYESSTGELYLSMKDRLFTVRTRASVGLIGSAGQSVETPAVQIKISHGEGAAFLSAIDVAHLEAARRFLLVFATDSRNTGMQFRDSSDSEIVSIGRLPVVMRDGTVDVTVRNLDIGRRNWKLYSIDSKGNRIRQLSLNATDEDTLRFRISLAELKPYPTPYFELIASSR